jgi:hypothetical protein
VQESFDGTSILATYSHAWLRQSQDRPLERPDTRQPSVMGMELVAWELVTRSEGLPNTISEDGHVGTIFGPD